MYCRRVFPLTTKNFRLRKEQEVGLVCGPTQFGVGRALGCPLFQGYLIHDSVVNVPVRYWTAPANPVCTQPKLADLEFSLTGFALDI